MRFTPILSFIASTLPNILNMLRAHWVGHNLKRLKKIPSYSTYGNPHSPPSINAIIGITTTSVGLFSCHSPKWQCSISTLLGILYHLLNSSLCSSVSTKLKKSIHLKEKKEISRRHPKSIKKKNHEDTYKKIEEKGLLGRVIGMGDWVFFFSF